MTGPIVLPEIEHIARRPSWDCVACDEPWPCDTARIDLILQMDPLQLAMYCWLNLEEATGQLPPTPMDELWDRFIAWTRPQRPAA